MQRKAGASNARHVSSWRDPDGRRLYTNTLAYAREGPKKNMSLSQFLECYPHAEFVWCDHRGRPHNIAGEFLKVTKKGRKRLVRKP
jgi:hypothetical protein